MLICGDGSETSVGTAGHAGDILEMQMGESKLLGDGNKAGVATALRDPRHSLLATGSEDDPQPPKFPCMVNDEPMQPAAKAGDSSGSRGDLTGDLSRLEHGDGYLEDFLSAKLGGGDAVDKQKLKIFWTCGRVLFSGEHHGDCMLTPIPHGEATMSKCYIFQLENIPTFGR